jgi:hypothetical protein
MAGETRRFHEEHDESQRKHREVMDRVDEVLMESRIHDRNVD